VAGGGTRRYRLTGTGVFAELFRTGSRREGAWLQVVAAPARTPPGRTGFVIGKKALKSAVARNRVRRVLRAVVHEARPATAAFDVIVRLKRGCGRDEVAAVAAEARALLAALAAPATGDHAQGAPR
jgi:ribonuclease P protein component